jgi:hypothetical protein
MSQHVRISVVLATSEVGAALEKCLSSLVEQGDDNLEIIVAAAAGEDGVRLSAPYSAVRLLNFSKLTSKPELLKQALLRASGEIVAVTEPNCCFPPHWVETLRRAHQFEYTAIGGAVAYGGDESLGGWACFLADYGPFLPPESRRVSKLLAGNHISYKRSALVEASDCWQGGYIKIFLLQELERRGGHFLFEPELVLHYTPERDPWRFARCYYANGRDFALARAASFATIQRLGHIVLAPLLPALLLSRRIRAVWPKREHRSRLVRAVPLIAIFVLCWSAGELAGYFRALWLYRVPERCMS